MLDNALREIKYEYLFKYVSVLSQRRHYAIRIAGLLWGEYIGYHLRGVPLQTASNRERVVEQTVELSVISDVMTLLWRHWLCRWWDKIKISFLTIPWFQE